MLDCKTMKTLMIIILLLVTINGIRMCKYDGPCFCKVQNGRINCYEQEIDYKDPLRNLRLEDVTELKYYHFNDTPLNFVLRLYRNVGNINIKFGNFNQIKTFAFVNLKNLEILTIMESNVTDINRKAFYNLTALKKLALPFNRITIIHKDAFYNLPKLVELALTGNKITSLQDGTFSQLANLNQLELNWNPLKKLQQNLFGQNIRNFFSDGSFLWFTTDNMRCDSELLWIIEIFKYVDKRIDFTSNRCLLTWKRDGLLDLAPNERYVKYFEAALEKQQTPSVNQLSSKIDLITDNISIINPSINVLVTLNHCHTPEDDDETPDFLYK